jgi:hypothetical protein
LKVRSRDELISAVLRGGDLPCLATQNSDLAESLLERSQFHGVQPLLNERMRGAQGWPSVVLQALHREALARTMWELRHQQVLARTLSALANIGIHPILFKGTALAYSVYTNPVLRVRGDTDFIIQPHERVRLHEALTALGFKGEKQDAVEFVRYTTNYTLEAEGNGTHTLDVHWRISNRHSLSELFSYEELRNKAVPLPDLCPEAVGVGPIHGLLVACMHRAGHKQSAYYVNGVAHYSGDRLIWIYDIHLLASVLTLGQWQEFLDLATEKGLRATCLEGLELARARFHTRFPEFVLTALAQVSRSDRASSYLNASRLRQHCLDVFAIEGLSNRIRFIRELVFPPSEFMREIYPQAKLDWLPWLYLRRGWRSVISRRIGILKTK